MKLSRNVLRLRSRRQWLVLLVLGLVVGAGWVNTAAPSAVDAASKQIVIFDHVGVQDQSTYWEPTLNQPASYTAAPNYAGGTAYLKLQVLSKPSNKPMVAQVCFWRHTASQRFKYETCSRARTQSITITGTGTSYINMGSPDSWWKKNGVYDWSKQASLGRIMLKDPDTGSLFLSSRCGAACYKGNDLGRHVPVRWSAQMVFVAEGATFDPPPGWNDTGGGSGGGGSSTGGSSSGGSGGSSTGGSSSGGSSGGGSGGGTTTTLPLDPVPTDVIAQRAVASQLAERTRVVRNVAPPD